MTWPPTRSFRSSSRRTRSSVRTPRHCPTRCRPSPTPVSRTSRRPCPMRASCPSLPGGRALKRPGGTRRQPFRPSWTGRWIAHESADSGGEGMAHGLPLPPLCCRLLLYPAPLERRLDVERLEPDLTRVAVGGPAELPGGAAEPAGPAGVLVALPLHGDHRALGDHHLAGHRPLGQLPEALPGALCCGLLPALSRLRGGRLARRPGGVGLQQPRRPVLLEHLRRRARLAGPPHPGHPGDQPDDRLEVLRVLRAHLPGGAAIHPPGAV